MQVAKWGNSLAIRISADVARELGLAEGDDISVRSLKPGELAVITERERREAALSVLRAFRGTAPPGFKFDREAANAR